MVPKCGCLRVAAPNAVGSGCSAGPTATTRDYGRINSYTIAKITPTATITPRKITRIGKTIAKITPRAFIATLPPTAKITPQKIATITPTFPVRAPTPPVCVVPFPVAHFPGYTRTIANTMDPSADTNAATGAATAFAITNAAPSAATVPTSKAPIIPVSAAPFPRHICTIANTDSNTATNAVTGATSFTTVNTRSKADTATETEEVNDQWTPVSPRRKKGTVRAAALIYPRDNPIHYVNNNNNNGKTAMR